MNVSIFARNVPGMRDRLQRATVGLAGCGGLGTHVALALTRAGIGRLILVDHDIVYASNLNRQCYFQSDLGRPKVVALREQVAAIGTGVAVAVHQERLCRDDVGARFAAADLLVEAFDQAEAKQWLIEAWCRAYPDRPIVAASGIGGYGRTNELRVRSSGQIHFCGDGVSDMALGLCAARVALVAHMQANLAIELLMDRMPAHPPPRSRPTA